eukprot:9344490-Lingulodinium_polyedra.AAC.1
MTHWHVRRAAPGGSTGSLSGGATTQRRMHWLRSAATGPPRWPPPATCPPRTGLVPAGRAM